MSGKMFVVTMGSRLDVLHVGPMSPIGIAQDEEAARWVALRKFVNTVADIFARAESDRGDAVFKGEVLLFWEAIAAKDSLKALMLARKMQLYCFNIIEVSVFEGIPFTRENFKAPSLEGAIVRLFETGDVPWKVTKDDGKIYIQCQPANTEHKGAMELIHRDDVTVLTAGTYCLQCGEVFKPYTAREPHSHEEKKS